jgi:malate permease and related proteins
LANIYLLIVCLISGILFRKSKLLPENSHVILNNVIMYICLPALALLYIPELKISIKIIYPLIVTYIVFGLAVLFFIFLGKILKLDSSTVGALILTAGLCNTSFVGFPVLIALFGEEGLKVGVLIDQAGSFVILATAGTIVASVYSHGKIEYKSIAKKILVYPSFIAFISGIVLNIFDFHFEGVLKDLLEKAGSPMAFLALISVGLQLKVNLKGLPVKELLTGLSYKLLIAPLIIYILYFVLLKGSGLDVQVSLIEIAMPPMVMGAVLASSFNLNPRLANLMVGIGIPLSFLTLAFWYYIIR